MDTATETPVNIPSGYLEVKRSEQILKLNSQDIPWASQTDSQGKPLEGFTIPLASVKVQGLENEFLLGSFISSDLLRRAAQALDEHRSAIANKLFYAHLPHFLQEGKTERVVNARTDQPVFYFKNNGGQRVYFMKFEVDGQTAIIRIAVCDKAEEENVLATITTQKRKRLRSILTHR